MDRKSLVVVLGVVTFVLAMALARLARGGARATARHVMIEIFSGLVAAAIAVWFTDSPPGLSPTHLMLSLRNAVLPTTTETPAPTAAPAPDLPFPRQAIPPLASRSPGPAHPAPPPNQTPVVSSPSRTPAIIPVTASAFTPLSTTSTDPATPIAGLAVTVDNGNTARRAVVTLSANTGVDPDAEVRLAYSVDGASPRENVYGPSDLASHQQYSEVRVVTAVIPLAAGTHTLTPYWRVSAAPGAHATMDARCLTVESEASDVAATEPIVSVTASAFSPLTTTSANPAQPIPGLTVTVSNGNTARRAVVTLSANTGVDPNAEVRLTYSIDGAPPQENAYGPASLASHHQYYEGKAMTAVIPLPAGTHTITAYWRVIGPPGAAAHMDARCLTVESTKIQ
jgi:hypothetical protein